MSMALHLHEINPFFMHAVAEHRELHHEYDRLRNLILSEEPVTATRVTEALEKLLALRNHLARHFTQEEKGGCLEEAMTRLPRIESEVTAIMTEHGDLLKAVNKLLVAARVAERPEEAWDILRRGFPVFAARLQAHEAAEHKLLQTAFNEDLGL